MLKNVLAHLELKMRRLETLSSPRMKVTETVYSLSQVRSQPLNKSFSPQLQRMSRNEEDSAVIRAKARLKTPSRMLIRAK